MAVKELDFEISNGHYALVVTATDQCPNPDLRLTSSTTVNMQTEHTPQYLSVLVQCTPIQHILQGCKILS